MLQGREGEARAAALVHLQIAWAHALRLALRRHDPWGELEQLLPEDVLRRVRGAANVPTALQAEMGRLLAKADQSGALDSMQPPWIGRSPNWPTRRAGWSGSRTPHCRG